MKLFSRIRNAYAGFRADVGYGTPAPDADYWYGRPGIVSAAGTHVSPETAMRLAAVYACVRVISETIASLPLQIYRRRADGGKELATDHPLVDVFHKPNTWQTSFEFWEMMQVHLELRGNAYSQIVAGNGRAIDQLIPIHPDRVRVFRLEDRRLRYEVTSYYDGRTYSFTQDEIFHLRGMSSDGIMGLSTITAASEVVGTGLAQQEHRARYFSNNAIPGLYFKPATKMDPEARTNLQNSIREGFSGSNAFKAMVGLPAMDVTSLGLTNKDSQLIEASQASRTDICSMFRIQPHKIGDLSRGTFSNIEQQNIEFATDSVRPRVVRLERRIDCSLVEPVSEGYDGNNYFCAFDLDAIFRGDMKSRYEAYNLALQYWLTRNEVRAAEGKNPIEGADELLQPANMLESDEAEANQDDDVQEPDESAEPIGDENEDDSGNASSAHLRAIATSAARRIVRREVKGIRKLLTQGLGRADFERAVADFYGSADDQASLVALIRESLVLSKADAAGYARSRIESICARPDQAIAEIEFRGPQVLVDLALTQKERA